MLRELTRGIFRENPLFVILLGCCPALAITDKVFNAIGMGAGVLFVLIGSNLAISLLRDHIPASVKVPAYIVIIAALVSVVDLCMQAFVPALSRNLGIYVPLIAVNCLILGRAEAFAARNGAIASVFDAIGMGIGFAIALFAISFIRELAGTGRITWFMFPDVGEVATVIPGLVQAPVTVLAMPAGALLLIGYLKAFFNWFESRGTGRER